MKAVLTPSVEAQPALLQGVIEFWLQRAAGEVTAQVESTLDRLATGGGCSVVSDGVQRLVLGGPRSSARWELSWRLVSHLGVALRAGLVVAEDRPELIRARVDGRVVAECDLEDRGGWRQLGLALARQLDLMRIAPLAA